MKRKIGAKEIALMGLLIAMQIILTRQFVIQTEFFRISFSFIAVILMGWLFGPLFAAIGNGLADMFGFVLRPVGMFFPGYTLTAAIEGLVYGLFFYKKEMTLGRNIVGNLAGSIVSTGLNTVWLFMTMGKASTLAYLPTRLVAALVLLVVKILVIELIAKRKMLTRLISK
ncbi:folate family ECF transporter S component [Vagococcus xieshaowenii]|uniref:Folate family ECF transporter S component n=1 Tax=Vagococcus xieshaowenii TaxID=2562451 RepID=A0AAJ5JLV5_9ENTE|nr:folate family ECF transporter S component [Vagococcus xieshaowenii]QCA27972.1 folate family ECF transporter S component [Vagococcus xieshaowenii]TFZ41261.1 folate family ECF transporter S component [Vagococcus xieshaowenii]